MSKAPRRKTLTLVLILTLSLAALGVAAWTAVISPARGLTNMAMPTLVYPPFAVVEIAKPTVTPISPPANTPIPVTLPTEEMPIVTQTPTPVETATVVPTVESLVYAEIVEVAPAPGYSNTTQYDVPPVYNGNKYILVDISEQHMYVYEGDVLVNDFVSSTGMNNATRAGHFSVLDKIPNAYGATWDIWMPNWLGIYWAGSMENGIHALPILPNGATLWAGYLSVPISYGCVVLGTYEAQWLYDWAEVGTPVEIQW